jgi:diadenosine tetraphosphatase ApaH/serine/threonine PP2A family protein phosphatase
LRCAVISDIHANLEALSAVLERIDALGVDQIVCLGDVVGYNASPDECIDIIRERNVPTLCGNHDAVACGLEEPWGFNPVALAAALWTREHIRAENIEWLKSLPDSLDFDTFLAVHGSPSSRDTYLFTWEDVSRFMPILEDQDRRVCFFGHTHSPGIYSSDGVYAIDEDGVFILGENKRFFINPGSVGQPRDGDARAAFGTYDTSKGEFRQFRVGYDVKSAADRVVNAGLPRFLAERLSLGR